MENYRDKIQDYIEGILESEELGDFERQLASDSELRNLVSLQREVHEILNKRVHSKEIELRNTLVDAERRQRFGKARNLFDFKKLASVAVAVCVLIAAALFFFQPSSSLYDLPIMTSEIVRGAEFDAQYEAAVKSFNAREFEQTISLLTPLVKDKPDVLQYQYYLGLAHLGQKDWKNAIDILEPISAGQSVFVDESKYYLAICYMENGDKEKAVNLLNEIPKSGSLGDKVQKILKKLD